MMASADPSPIPKWAVTMWSDARHIYVALPMTAGGIPYITKFDFTEGGLTRALNVLRAHQPEALVPTTAAPANYTIPPRQPMVRLTKAQAQLHAETTEAQRENARKVLAKMGLK